LLAELFSCFSLHLPTLFELLELFDCEWNFADLESSVFWDIMPYSPLKINQNFGEYIATIFTVGEYVNQAGYVCQLLPLWFLGRRGIRR
jgi:hypothetical protein